MAILEMKQITKLFPGGVIANENVDLFVEEGEIHALLGENGAGKTTLMNILYGLYHAEEGEIWWKGEEVKFGTPGQAIANGIGMVHQHFMLIPTLTVWENVILGLEKGYKKFNHGKKICKEIEELVKKYGLIVDPVKKVSELSVGEAQRVEIIKALYRNAKLLILDEPTAVLTPHETQEFFKILKRLKEEGHSVIIITHRMSEIMAISDRVTVLRDGKNEVTLHTKETSPKELSLYMVGRELDESYEKLEFHQKNTMLTITGLSASKGGQLLLKDIHLEVLEGEVLGIAGVDGNGQKELAQVIAGIQKYQKGEIRLGIENIDKCSVKARYDKGIAYIPDDRHHDGLAMDLSLEKNIMLRSYNKKPYVRRGISMSGGQMKIKAESAIENFQIKTPSRDTKVRLLSGGNQQKIILAREMAGKPELLIASQPTRGLDIGASESVRKNLMEQRNRNKSVLLISADLEEILQLSDRIAVMFGGKIMGILENQNGFDVGLLGMWMAGHQEETDRGNHNGAI